MRLPTRHEIAVRNIFAPKYPPGTVGWTESRWTGGRYAGRNGGIRVPDRPFWLGVVLTINGLAALYNALRDKVALTVVSSAMMVVMAMALLYELTEKRRG